MDKENDCQGIISWKNLLLWLQKLLSADNLHLSTLVGIASATESCLIQGHITAKVNYIQRLLEARVKIPSHLN